MESAIERVATLLSMQLVNAGNIELFGKTVGVSVLARQLRHHTVNMRDQTGEFLLGAPAVFLTKVDSPITCAVPV